MQASQTLARLLVTLLLLLPLKVLAGESRESCKVCGMWIDQFTRTTGELVHPDGNAEHTCGVACMLRTIEDRGVDSFHAMRVKDWSTGKPVDARQAWYLLGSRLVPDMLPNYIAFADRQEAEALASREGGEVLSFAAAMDTISPRGMTQPFRIRQAVTPGKGSIGMGLAYAYMVKDRVVDGSDGQDPEAFIGSNPAQPRAPERIEVQTQSLSASYALTDRLAAQLIVPYYEKEAETLTRQGGRIVSSSTQSDGLGDLGAELRYNLWRSIYYDRFFTVLLGATLPTGEFDSHRSFNPALQAQVVETGPGMQLGYGTATLHGGLLYSQRWSDFWFHAQGLYRHNPENGDDYKYGDETQAGVALHYTPNYDLMLGLELDALLAAKNEDRGIELGNTGGTRVNLAAVCDWRFANLLGGNLTLRGSAGLPLYEDLNSQDFVNAMGREFTQVQLGGGFFAGLVLNYNFRFGQF
jgi:nitrous oxide reductase accessory protein NosL